MEKEFVDFLVVNGIVADEWQGIKANEPDQAQRIISLFSDVVFESILRKTEYLEKWEAGHISTFQCLKDKMVLVQVEAKPSSGVNFLEEELQNVLENRRSDLQVFHTSKAYIESRELEIFKMTNQGCVRSNGELFKKLCLLLN